MEIFFSLIILVLVILIYTDVRKIKENSDLILQDKLYDIKKYIQQIGLNYATKDDLETLLKELKEKTDVDYVTDTPQAEGKTEKITPKEEVLSDEVDAMIKNLLNTNEPVNKTEIVSASEDENKPGEEIQTSETIQTPPPVLKRLIPVNEDKEDTPVQSLSTTENIENTEKEVHEELIAELETVDSASGNTTNSTTYAGANRSQYNRNGQIIGSQINYRTEENDEDHDDDDEKSFIEKIFSANSLSKIGIITFVLGIAFFVKYAIDQNWINEVARVGIGFLTGAIIIGVAHQLKNKYKVFSSILVGGGIATFYITVAIAFQEYHLFGQTPAFVMSVAITILAVYFSILYDRSELAIFALIGGYIAPFIASNGSGNYVVLFTYIFILNTGMLVLAHRKNWKIIGMIAYPITILQFVIWMAFEGYSKTKGAIIFSSLFYIQFYTLAFIEYFKNNCKISGFQAILILSSNTLFYFCLIGIANYHNYNVKGLVTIALAIINAIILYLVYRRKDTDKNIIYMLIGMVMTFVTLAIPIQLDGCAITIFWAAEAVILLWLWRSSKQTIFFAGTCILYILTIGSYILDISSFYEIRYTYNMDSHPIMPIVFNQICLTGIVLLASIFASKYIFPKEEIQDPDTNNIYHLVYFLLKYSSFIFIFLVPFMEINYQIENRIEMAIEHHSGAFKQMVLFTYISCYISSLAFVYRNKKSASSLIFGLLMASAILYTMAFPFTISNLRSDIYEQTSSLYPKWYFAIHFLALPAFVYIVYSLAKKSKEVCPEKLGLVWTLLSLMSVILVCVEVEDISIMISNNPNTYNYVLRDIRTFGYPIIWGISAFILMVCGIRYKEYLLRKISIFGFVIIIAKLYIIDIWKMSAGGRIASFVVLGIILLVVSFMLERIKNLMKDETKNETKETINSDEDK